MSGGLPYAVPFPARVHPHAHPDRLAVMARLHGVDAPMIEEARVLEIGCGEGGNLAAIASTLPKARIVGLDLSAERIRTGRTALEAAGITNVDLRIVDVAEVKKKLGTFDYVFCHGLLSTVSTDTQDAILALVGRSLSPRGVAYLAYDTMPGWHGLTAVREMLLFDARGIKEPAERVARARAYVEWLLHGGAPSKADLEEVARLDDETLARKFLGPFHKPVHFQKLAMRARRFGLAYLCEAEPAHAADHDAGAHGQMARERSPDELMWAEQHYDFLVGRRARATLFCRRDAEDEIARSMEVRPAETMLVTSRAEPEEPGADPRTPAPATFHAAAAQMTTSHPALKAAMLHLDATAPRAIPLPELVGAARERLGAAWDAADEDLLRENLLRTFLSAASLLELRAYAPPAVAASERPRASAWARYGAEISADVANLRHERVHLDDTMRKLLRLCDGTRDRTAIANAMAADLGDRRADRASIDGALAALGRAALFAE